VENCLGLTHQSAECLRELSEGEMGWEYSEANCLAGKLVRRELTRVNVEGELSGENVQGMFGNRMQDYKSLHAVCVMICATLVYTQTHTQSHRQTNSF